LASKFRNDRDAYAEAKTTFIEQALAANAAEAPTPDRPPG
jgi:hypothetical protein